MKNLNRTLHIAAIPALIVLVALTPATFAQQLTQPTGTTPMTDGNAMAPAAADSAPMGLLKGRVVDDRTREPLTDIKVRLIGFNGEALTNARGEFFLEAPARTYAGMVMEFPGNGQMRLREEPIAMAPGQFLNLDQITLKPLIEKEPLALPTPDPRQSNETNLTNPGLENPIGNPMLGPNPNDLGVANQVMGTVTPIAQTPIMGGPALLGAPAEPAPTTDIHPVLLKARSMTAEGNYFGADRAYEEYLSLFPSDGPVAVEYGLMVYHNIQNAAGRTILKEASKLPGLRPIDIDQINRLLIPTTILVSEPDYQPHVRVRLRHRHKACH